MALYSMQEAIERMLTESNWKTRYQATKLKQDWPKLMGNTVAKHTKELIIQEGVLTIYTDVAPLKHELRLNKHLLIKKINDFFNDNTFIKDIVIK